VIWVALGGRGTLYGAALGAVIVNFAKSYFTGAIPDFWLYALGALFVFVTLFMPKGIVGTLKEYVDRGQTAWSRAPQPSPLSPMANRAVGGAGE
jgi:urea transport system permease protein